MLKNFFEKMLQKNLTFSEALYTTKRNGRDGFRIYHEVEEKEV